MNSQEKWSEMEDDLNDAYEKRSRAIATNGNEGINYEYQFIYDFKDKDLPNRAVDRKATPVFSGVLAYFPDALKEVSKCSLAGQKQHNQGDKLYWDKDKSNDNSDALVRHLIDHSVNPIDDDGVLHLSKVAWRALAVLQIYLEKQNGK
tara:strand:- start:1089 stop:1532 length:444 start_codon:yes stop_codon:yes gene_type:complete